MRRLDEPALRLVRRNLATSFTGDKRTITLPVDDSDSDSDLTPAGDTVHLDHVEAEIALR